MWYEIRNSDFSDIGTAVLYRVPRVNGQVKPFSVRPQLGSTSDINDWYCAGPTDSRYYELFKASDIKYCGSKENIMIRDFTEYDFSYLFKKYGFNDNFLMSDIRVGLALERDTVLEAESVDILNSALFPTLIEDESPEDYYGYFGSSTIDGRTFYMFDCSEDVYKIELYDGIIYNNTDNPESPFMDYDYITWAYRGTSEMKTTASPVIVIHTGPKPEWSNNDDSLYFGASGEISRTEGAKPDLYAKLRSELEDKKVVWMVLGPSSSDVEANLMLSSWKKNINPDRNRHKWSLRHDDYNKELGIIEKTGNAWYDGTSGTLLGNDTPRETPIKARKEKHLHNASTDYSPYKRYRAGDIVKLGGVLWESVRNGNLGNNPYTSSSWVLGTRASSHLTSRVRILISPEGSGFTLPGGEVAVSLGTEMTFIIHTNLGWTLDNERPCSYEEGKYVEGTVVTSTIGKDGIEVKKVRIDQWEDVINNNTLIFNFIPQPSIISYSLFYNNTYIKPADRTTYLETPLPLTSGKEYLEVKAGSDFALDVHPLSNFDVSSVVSVYTETELSDETKMRTLNVNRNTAMDKIDFYSANYNIYLSDAVKKVRFIEGAELFDISRISSSVHYGDSLLVSFSSALQTTGYEDKKLIIELEEGIKVGVTLLESGIKVYLISKAVVGMFLCGQAICGDEGSEVIIDVGYGVDFSINDLTVNISKTDINSYDMQLTNITDSINFSILYDN